MPLRPVCWTLFLLLWISFSWFHRADPSWNAYSRLALTFALLDSGSAEVDRYVLPREPTRGRVAMLVTGDLAYYRGHYYSDKIIGTSLLGLPAYALTRLAEESAGGRFAPTIRHWIISVLSVSVMGALAGILFFQLLVLEQRCLAGTRRGGAAPPRIWGPLLITIFTMLGTVIWLYGSLFMSYLPALFFLTAALLRFERWRCAVRTPEGTDASTPQVEAPPPPFFTTGLLMGLAILCEYLAGFAAVFFGFYAIACLREGASIRERFLGLVRYAAGGFLGVLPFFVYTWLIFGNISVPYQYHDHELFRVHMARGLMGATVPDPDALLLLTFHPYRGLFVHSPWLLAAAAGVLWALRNTATRKLALLAGGIYLAQLLFNSAYYMWWGGWSFGPRHLIPAIPFLALGALWMWQRGGMLGRSAVVGLGLVSIALHAVVAAVYPQIPDLYDPRTPLGMRLEWLLEPDLSEYDYPWTFPLRIWPMFKRGLIEMNLGEAMGAPMGWPSYIPLLLFWGIGLTFVALWHRRGRRCEDTYAAEEKSGS